MNGLRLLNKRNMVIGLPDIGDIGLCEGCVFGKQSKLPFPKDKSMRATKVLELVHTDLCGRLNRWEEASIECCSLMITVG